MLRGQYSEISCMDNHYPFFVSPCILSAFHPSPPCNLTHQSFQLCSSAFLIVVLLHTAILEMWEGHNWKVRRAKCRSWDVFAFQGHNYVMLNCKYCEHKCLPSGKSVKYTVPGCNYLNFPTKYPETTTSQVNHGRCSLQELIYTYDQLVFWITWLASSFCIPQMFGKKG